MIANTMGELLGYGQAETILTRYNNLGGGNLALKSSQQLKSNKITFPLIYPELKKYFPQKLEAIMQQKEFSSYKNQIRA